MGLARLASGFLKPAAHGVVSAQFASLRREVGPNSALDAAVHAKFYNSLRVHSTGG